METDRYSAPYSPTGIKFGQSGNVCSMSYVTLTRTSESLLLRTGLVRVPPPPVIGLLDRLSDGG